MRDEAGRAVGAALASAEASYGERHLALASLRRSAAHALRSRLESAGADGRWGRDGGIDVALLQLLLCSLGLWNTQRRLLGECHPERASQLGQSRQSGRACWACTGRASRRRARALLSLA